MVRIRGLEQEDEVTSVIHNQVLEDAISGYPTIAERNADFFAPVTNLWEPRAAEDPPTLGENVSIEGTDRFFGAWAGDTFKHWRRVAETESGVIQVVVGDTTATEELNADSFADFEVWLVDADATLSDLSVSSRGVQPRRLDGRVLVDYRFVEYDPRPYADRNTPLVPEARAGVDFYADVGTIIWEPTDASIVQTIRATIRPDGEVEGNERFQVELFNFRGAKPLKDIGICIITNRRLPLLRAEDITIQTRRAAATDPLAPPDVNIAQVRETIPIALSEAASTDTRFNYRTLDDTATAAGGDYTAIPITLGVIRAGQTTPETPVVVTIPRQPLEATERFRVELSPVPGEHPTALYVKPVSIVTIAGAALKPTIYSPFEYFGPGEGGPIITNIPVKVQCSPAPTSASGPITIRWNTDDTPRTSTFIADEGYHYLSASGTITFAVGETEKIMNVPTGWDFIYHPSSTNPRDQEDIVELQILIRITSGDGQLENQLGGTGIMRAVVQLSAVREGDTADPNNNSMTALDQTVEEPPGSMAQHIVRIPCTLDVVPATGVTAQMDFEARTGGNFGTAVNNVDFRVATRRGLTWTAAIGKTAYIDVAILRNLTRTGDRYFTINFENPRQCRRGVDSIRITILDRETDRPDAQYQVTSQDRTIIEPSTATQTIQLPVIISQLPPAGTTISCSYSLHSGVGTAGAISGTHYQRQAIRTLEWNSSSSIAQTATFVINGGLNLREGRHFRVVLGEVKSPGVEIPRPAGYRMTILPRGPTEGVISALPLVEAADVTVREDAGQANILAQLSRSSQQEARCTYTMVDETARNGVDYTGATGELVWPAGQTIATLTIPILVNDRDTEDTTFRINWSGGINCTPPSAPTRVNITNVGAAPVSPEPTRPPSVSITDNSVLVPTTGTATGYLTVASSRTLDEPITGTATTRTDGTARAGTHYNALTLQPWTIPGGQSRVRVPVTILAGTLTSNLYVDVDIAVTSTNATLSTVAGESRGRLTLTSSTVPITLSVANLTLTSRGETANVVVTRTGSVAAALTFTVATFDVSARSGINYTAILSRRVTIPAGEVSVTIEVETEVARSRTPEQTFIVRISNPTAGTVVKSDGTVTLPAFNPAVTQIPTITIEGGSATEPPAGGRASVTFTIKSSKVWTEEINGSYSTSNVTATAGDDYTAVSGTWRIPVGQQEVTVSVPVLSDVTQESAETFRMNIDIDSGNARFPAGATSLFAVGTISNRGTTGEIRLFVANQTALFRGGTFDALVHRRGSTVGAATCIAETYSTGSATAGTGRGANNPASDIDYTTVSNYRVTIPAGEVEARVPIPINTRWLEQPRETFGFRIRTPGGTGVVLGTTSATITLPAVGATPIEADARVKLTSGLTSASLRVAFDSTSDVGSNSPQSYSLAWTARLTDPAGNVLVNRSGTTTFTHLGGQRHRLDNELATISINHPNPDYTTGLGLTTWDGDPKSASLLADTLRDMKFGELYVSVQKTGDPISVIDIDAT